MAERRASVRNRSFLKGKLFFDNRRSSVDCVVRDYSESGMRLEFSDSITIPGTVEIYIPSKDQTIPAQVRWRKGQETGVESDVKQPETTSVSDLDLSRRVQALEAETKTLRRLLSEMKSDLRTRSEAS